MNGMDGQNLSGTRVRVNFAIEQQSWFKSSDGGNGGGRGDGYGDGDSYMVVVDIVVIVTTMVTMAIIMEVKVVVVKTVMLVETLAVILLTRKEPSVLSAKLVAVLIRLVVGYPTDLFKPLEITIKWFNIIHQSVIPDREPFSRCFSVSHRIKVSPNLIFSSLRNVRSIPTVLREEHLGRRRSSLSLNPCLLARRHFSLSRIVLSTFSAHDLKGRIPVQHPNLNIKPFRLNMGLVSKQSKHDTDSEDESDMEIEQESENEEIDEQEEGDLEEGDGGNEEEEEDDGEEEEEDDGDEEEEQEDEDSADEEQEEDDEVNGSEAQRDEEIEELEKEYMNLRHEEQDILKNLKRHKDEDLLKGQAVKNQKTLWDKSLEFRFLMQKVFSSSNKLPQEPLRSSFCGSDKAVNKAYTDLITSSKETLGCLLELQKALLDTNPSAIQVSDGNIKGSKSSEVSNNSEVESDEEWLRIQQLHSRLAPFRNSSIDKWQRKTQVTTGAAGFKGKLHAFNQNISEQVAAYMRDPSRMLKRMQTRRSLVGVFGATPDAASNSTDKDLEVDGDPELLDDSEFYQQLLKEFLESFDPTSSESSFYALKRQQTKKRKIVDRRSSKSRKIRYHVHEKIVNFMAPEHMNLPPMAPKLFEDLFGLKHQKSASVA